MVRPADRRKRKYEKNVDAEQVKRAVEALKPIMVDQEKTYFPQITLIEMKTKALCEAQGIATYLIPQYINFARELYSKAKRFTQATLAAETQYLLNKWTSRGLLGSKLVEIAKLFGVTPTAPPPPPPPPHTHPWNDVVNAKLPLTRLPQHDNAYHSPDFISSITLIADLFEAGQISVGSVSEVVVANATVAVPPNWRFYIYLFFLCNFRWAAITGTPDIELWFAVNGTQRSAKFPIQAVDLSRHPFMMPITLRNPMEGMYWAAGFTEGSYLFEVRAQTTAQTCYVSHRQINAIHGLKEEI